MADYIYLLESRLSAAQQSALSAVREIARARALTVFLVGGAVRDLTSGSPVRDLDVSVQGNAFKMKKDLEKAGAQIAGEYEPAQALFVRFPGNVRMEISSTLTASYPKPGRPVFKQAAILEDLRRRDFTANAMALSLNEGSYGLLMDPLNGVADIENRELRLVSNYGFIEEPVRMIRAARLGARLGWQMEEKTQARYETGKAEDYIAAMNAFQRGYELEEIVHEEDPLRVLGRLESEGWMKVLCPAWVPGKVNVHELEKLKEAQAQLQMQGVQADASAAQFPLITAKMTPKDVASLKKSFPRQGFVAEINALEGEAKQFAAELGSKQAASPSATWKTIFAAPPEVVLWVAYSSRSATLQNKFKSFYTEWPTARQRIPYLMMQEMRIVPELPGYNELVERIFFELMDGRLGTPEEMKAFLEPHSPPAPPPPVNLRRARAKVAKPTKARKRETEDAADENGDALHGDLAAEAAHAVGGSAAADAVGLQAEAAATRVAAPAKVAAKATAVKAAVKPAAQTPGQNGAKPAALKAPAAGPKAKTLAKTPAKAPAKPALKKAAAKKPTPAKAAAKPAPGRAPAKAVQAKKKPAGKSASVAKKPIKPAKVAHKPAKKAVKAPVKGKAPVKKTTKPAAKSAKKPAKKGR